MRLTIPFLLPRVRFAQHYPRESHSLVGFAVVPVIMVMPRIHEAIMLSQARILIWMHFRYQVLPKLCSPLVDRDGMPDNLGRASRGVWKPAPLHPGAFEAWNAVDCVEEPEKPNAFDRATKCLAETFHI
jgi:hypothetical protein